MKSERGDIEIILGLIVILVVIGLLIGLCIHDYNLDYGNEQTVEITVKDKYIKGTNKSQKYLVVDTENNTYQITDLFFLHKWNSTDLYNQIDIGNTYKIETCGIRDHYWSHYPNINKVEKID